MKHFTRLFALLVLALATGCVSVVPSGFLAGSSGASSSPASTSTSPAPHKLGAPILTWGGDLAGSTMSSQVVSGIAGVSASRRGADHDSQINGDIGHPSWVILTPSAIPKMVFNADVGPDGYPDATDVNTDGAAPGNGLLEKLYTPPSGVTSVTFSVPDKLPSGVTGTNDIGLVITDSGATTVLGSAYAIPTASWQTLSVTLTVTPGTEYRLRIVTNTSGFGPPSPGQQRALLGRPALTVNTASDTFWSAPYDRYNIDARDLLDNVAFAGTGLGGGQVNSRYQYACANSRYEFFTTATSLYVETFNWNNPASNTNVLVLVNGRKFATVVGATLKQDMQKVTGLPTGLKRIELVSSSQNEGGAGFVNVEGQFLIGVYLPSAALMMPIRDAVPTDRTIVYGTSKDSGFYANDATSQGIIQGLRDDRVFGSVVSMAIGGRSLNWDYVAGGNSVIPVGQTLVAARPTHILLDQHRNDWGGPGASSPWGGVAGADETSWQNAMSALMTFIHGALPSCQQWIVYTSHETSESANTNGSTLANYYSGLDALFTSFAGWDVPPKKLDLRTLWSSASAGTYTTDGVHPNALGYAAINAYIKSQLGR